MQDRKWRQTLQKFVSIKNQARIRLTNTGLSLFINTSFYGVSVYLYKAKE